MGQGSTLCKVLFGLLFGILAILCVVGSIWFDEITKTPSSLGSYICGRESWWYCTGDIDECNDALVYGFNVDIEGIGIDDEDDVFITEMSDFETLCDGIFTGTIFEINSDEACDQVTAGKVFYGCNITAAILGGLAMIMLLVPMVRKISAALFILAAVVTSAAFVSFLGISLHGTCWDGDDNAPQPGASA